jgi:two-component system sensor histidine kinase PhcS
MLFGLLDIVMYEAISYELIAARTIADLILIFGLLVLCKKWSFNAKLISFAWNVVIIVLINVLIIITGEKSSSPYYAGLNLIIVSSTALLPWEWYEMSVICIIMLLSYAASAFITIDLTTHKLMLDEFDLPILLNNLFFLSSTGLFCILASYLNSKLRFKEFCLNHELKEKNETIISTQAQLVHSEKINAIGNLSAGLLHEVNNPLNYTMTALQVMKMDSHVSSDPELKDTMKDIEEGMTRIKHIVTDLRAFAYPEEADKKNQFTILGAIESALRFTAHDCQNIERTLDLEPNLIVSASKTHIVQVLINLISNASRAISKTERKGLIVVDAKQKNDRVVIGVSDNGTGMSEETLTKVFDPFFTTNEVGKGMGLGLSVSHTIIKNHGGNLLVTSKLGEGSRFYFDLAI